MNADGSILAPGTRCRIYGLHGAITWRGMPDTDTEGQVHHVPDLNGSVVVVVAGPSEPDGMSRPGPWYEIEPRWIERLGRPHFAHRDQLDPVEATIATEFVARY